MAGSTIERLDTTPRARLHGDDELEASVTWRGLRPDGNALDRVPGSVALTGALGANSRVGEIGRSGGVSVHTVNSNAGLVDARARSSRGRAPTDVIDIADEVADAVPLVE